jgi:hypothetical protein
MKKKIVLCLGIGVIAACSSSSTPGGGSGSTAAAVQGPADTHCNGKETIKVDPAVCHEVEDAGEADGGAGESGGDDYGETLYNAEGDDDDCKYHVKWTATEVGQNKDVTFNIVATNKSDNTPLTGAPIRLEVFQGDTHPGPNTDQKTTESPNGTYAVGPVKFDTAGKWTVRFHFHEECNDSETSQHGHVAFFVQVP